jgi:lipopolysaccharide transport system ATP-binding protein
MKSIIDVINISKKFKYGQKQLYLTLRESFIDFCKKPFSLLNNQTKRTENEFFALNNISFQISQGESVGIIGRNGAGKSTLLKILSRITPPTKGKIILHGRVSSLLEIGTGFHQELTGRENIYLNGAIMGMKQKEIKQKFDEIVDFAETEKFLDTPVKHYSSGMYIRLAFAIAAHINSEILLIDEELAVGDTAFQKKCLGKMENVASQGRTVLFVSHNMEAVRRICSRVILLDKGKVSADSITEKSMTVYNKLLRDIKIEGETAIGDTTVRRGSGIIRFTKVEIQNRHHRKQINFRMGETIRFKISYKVFQNIQGLIISISLRSGKTREIITSDKHVLSKKMIKQGTNGSVTIEWPNTNICPGEYPFYFHICPFEGRSMDFDVLDDLTSPLIILDEIVTKDPDSSRKFGYFSLPSTLVWNKMM